MARLNRVCPAGIPQHIIQRGNNRQVCFADEQDFVAYAGWLKEYAEKYQVDIHAWVFMTNHVHLLCTPGIEHGISQMMQAVGRQYVRHFNKTYRRSGTLWEGRFKSCLVQAENYLLHLHRYIELNPVRAGMVKQPSDYFWSSYSTNAFGKPSALCQHHSLYMRLANSREDRLENYRELFRHHVEGKLLEEIRSATNKGMALGNERFKEEIKHLTGRRMQAKKAGRPTGWRKKVKEV